MESFLTTLPPYVHEFLNKYPPTDVFNLLRELICFAVLYSNDRDRLNQSTEEFLKKREQPLKLESLEEEEVNQETEEEQLVSVSESPKEEQEKPTLPYTFPEWWGHQEFQPPKKKEPASPPPSTVPAVTEQPKPAVAEQPKPTVAEQPKPAVVKKEEVNDAMGSVWISWDDPKKNNMRRMEKARSQIIPDLRSYLEEDHTRMSAVKASPKRQSMVNLKTSTSPTNRTTHKTKTVVESPVSAPSKPPTVVKKPPVRSSSVNLQQPRQNAAMRARAEHARLQQQELEKKKTTTPPPGSSISLKIKQRVNSGIDWDKIKRERRQTITEPITKQ